jgi:transcriptional regulator with PAS, ATPase and Fis domain
MVERVADTDSTILILGESGTGKELIARALHVNSRRQFARFIPVNCSALPENLLESELFGHCKGSFTGAVADKKGLFHEADGGTIFLDEVGSMSPVLQSRLLRVLQEREVRRVGENIPTYINVRVLAATNEPLEKKIKDGTFREDLYYRLNVIAITLPSLRERHEDIPLLVAHFLRNKINPRTGQQVQITRQAMEILNAHDWPGNVRELENAIERAATLCEANVIQVTDLPPSLVAKFPQTNPAPQAAGGEIAQLPTPAGAPPNLHPIGASHPASPAESHPANRTDASLKDFMREQEVAYLNRVLAQVGGDKEQAALVLGVSLATLYRKLSEDERTP